ncbi:hypothetical protein ACLBV4_20995, partial [Pseudomonas aeruginosa]
MTSLPLEANAAATLAEWHGLIARRDLSGLPRLLARRRPATGRHRYFGAVP